MHNRKIIGTIGQFARQHVLVVGDVMLDKYIWGTVDRISPEAPVPIVAVNTEDLRPGGAANVALNLRALGAQVSLAGVVGTDDAGDRFQNVLDAAGIAWVLTHSSHRPTTKKTRIIAGNQHLIRLDYESTDALDSDDAKSVIENVLGLLSGADAIILQDYDKGVLSPPVITALCSAAHKASVPVFVDPKRKHLDSFNQIQLLKPNLSEAEHFVGRELVTDDDLAAAGDELRSRINSAAVLITRGPAGMDLIDAAGHHRIATRARDVADVCGAGDTVIATYALAAITGLNPQTAAELANIAAGVVVEEMGVVPISAARLIHLLESNEPG